MVGQLAVHISKMKPKRSDLQGLRGIAIIAVVGFHFYPRHVPNGYFGVDLFFVLSGFLMCMLLKRAENESPCSLISLFYSKRFKRILPLYLLVIFLSMVALYNLFPDTAIETNKASASHALLFVSNRPSTVQEDYFAMLSIAVDIFTHTWSLSVEIQFYLLVPIIFIFGRRAPENYEYGHYGALAALSFLFSATSNSTVAFNSVFARIWQFLIGMMVHIGTVSRPRFQYKVLPEDAEGGREDCETFLDEEDESSESSLFSHVILYIILTFLVIVLFFPITLPANITRPLVTVATGLLMLISEEDNQMLSNKVLTYLGDISYSLYLIHWPIYAYWKLTADGSQYALMGALLVAVILASIAFETFEKWYLKLSSASVGSLVVALFFFNALAINKDAIQEHIETFGNNVTSLDGVTDNMTLGLTTTQVYRDDAARLNYRWSVNDNQNLFTSSCRYESVNTPLGWCRHTGLPPNGKYKLAIIGNSWTANHANIFYQECGHKAKSIMQGSAYACEPLYPTQNSEVCRSNFTDFEERIRKEKPDYTFIFTRFISIGDPSPANVTGGIEEDPIYRVMLNQTLKFIENIKYKLFILNYIPRVNTEVIERIVPMLKNHMDPKVIDNRLVNFGNLEMARRRHSQLERDCGEKCVFVDYIPHFWNTSTRTFRYFDERGFSYFTSSTHLSPRGLEHVRHVWTDICRKL